MYYLTVISTCVVVVYEYTRSYSYNIIEVCETLASIARKSRDVTGSHPDLCNTVPGIVFAVVKSFFL